MKLGIFILYVRDVEKQKAFYSNVIGLPIDAGQTNDRFVMLCPAESPLLALEDIAISPANQTTPAGGCEIGFSVDDVDATWRGWKAKGVEMVTEVEDKPFGRTFTAKDPEGNFVTVYG